MVIYGKKLTNSKILIILTKWSGFLVDLTISDPLTNGQLVTIHMPWMCVHHVDEYWNHGEDIIYITILVSPTIISIMPSASTLGPTVVVVGVSPSTHAL